LTLVLNYDIIDLLLLFYPLPDCDRLPEEQAQEMFGVGFGQLNPFTLYIGSNPDNGKYLNTAWHNTNPCMRIHQIFDRKGLELINQTSGLVATNPGHKEYTIQFDP